MPRREQPLEVGDDALMRFAGELRRLRESAGKPTYRQLSARAHYSAAALSEAASGRKLPSLAVTMAYVAACDGDSTEWRKRWRETADATNGHGPDNDLTGPAPYVGLAAFQPGDSERFFGRDALVENLVTRIRDDRFLGVFGASGSGKSSALRAGLVPRLDNAVVFTPGPRPVEECAVRLGVALNESPAVLHAEFTADPGNLHLRVRQALAGRPGTDLVLVVDQFEEIFTVCPEDQRTWMVDALTTAAFATTSRTRVVIGVRADFYGHCGQHPRLVEALRNAPVLVGPMTADELRGAITEPAVRAGCRVETALVARLIADATGQPAVLPLVSHALLETWRHRRGTTLTLAGYEGVGGVLHAIARSAEDMYTSLDGVQQDAARRLFLRMIALGDGTEDTKRRIRRDQLDDCEAVVDTLAAARLITVDRDTVELAHEALIRHWPRLRTWLTEDRDGLRIHRELTEATDAWESLNRDSGALYRGTRLTRADTWAATQNGNLSSREREFLRISLSTQTREQAATLRQTRRLRRLVALLAVLLVLAAVAVGYAVRAEQSATRERNAAIVQNALREAAAMRNTDLLRAGELTIAAYRVESSPVTRGSTLNALLWLWDAWLTGHTDRVRSVSISSDGRTLASASDDRTARLWALSFPAPVDQVEPATIKGYGDSATATVFNHDTASPALITASLDRKIRVFDVSNRRFPIEIAERKESDAIVALAISADDRTLAAATLDHRILLWDFTHRDNPTRLGAISGLDDPAYSMMFDPSGQTLAVGTNHDVRLYDLTEHERPRLRGTIHGGGGLVVSVSFHPTDHVVAVAGNDQTVRLWDAADPGNPRFLANVPGHSGRATATAFSWDGRILGTADDNGAISLWDITDRAKPTLFANLNADFRAVSSMAFNPDDHSLVVAGGNHIARFETDVEKAAGIICQTAGGITRDQWTHYFPGLDYQPPCP
ncbi:MAG TPA: XRE family transcriptional regulator [Actinophytocola sp.]|uniref:nSTAND1 domain-containing NTPase n=1 Tax=Actinophytocola sp. TaxID=1872138 RepID=UPI002E002904|nr:XRE family transcriptional regulator [Actinophytocola sp.]